MLIAVNHNVQYTENSIQMNCPKACNISIVYQLSHSICWRGKSVVNMKRSPKDLPWFIICTLQEHLLSPSHERKSERGSGTPTCWAPCESQKSIGKFNHLLHNEIFLMVKFDSFRHTSIMIFWSLSSFLFITITNTAVDFPFLESISCFLTFCFIKNILLNILAFYCL